MRINWVEEIKKGNGRYRIVDDIRVALNNGNFVVVEDTAHGTFTMTSRQWNNGEIIQGEPLVILDEEVI